MFRQPVISLPQLIKAGVLRHNPADSPFHISRVAFLPVRIVLIFKPFRLGGDLFIEHLRLVALVEHIVGQIRPTGHALKRNFNFRLYFHAAFRP